MGEIKPEIKVIKQKPLAEPPPSLEITEEEQQWLEDIQTPATVNLENETIEKIATLRTNTYHPQATIQINDENNHSHMLQKMINNCYQTKTHR